MNYLERLLAKIEIRIAHQTESKTESEDISISANPSLCFREASSFSNIHEFLFKKNDLSPITPFKNVMKYDI